MLFLLHLWFLLVKFGLLMYLRGFLHLVLYLPEWIISTDSGMSTIQLYNIIPTSHIFSEGSEVRILLLWLELRLCDTSFSSLLGMAVYSVWLCAVCLCHTHTLTSLACNFMFTSIACSWWCLGHIKDAMFPSKHLTWRSVIETYIWHKKSHIW